MGVINSELPYYMVTVDNNNVYLKTGESNSNILITKTVANTRKSFHETYGRL